MTTYLQALQAMEYLLDKAGEGYWRDWIREDIHQWETSRSASRHLSAYGGMGSFNDVLLCRQNGHQVTEAQEPWVQNLFEILKGLCYELARAPQSGASPPQALAAGQRHTPVVEAFRHGPEDEEQLASLARVLDELQKLLHGWRCLDCGYAETSPRRIDELLAAQLLPVYLAMGLKEVVDAAFAVNFPGLEAMRGYLASAARRSGIHVRKRKGWMRPCPRCKSANTAVYRWEKAASDPLTFRPSKIDPPVKDKR